ncbi:MAG: hypothetical protein FJ149_06620 [Euryarchaeota archaeon]|nr:hypothetical protein [Euryarchaeota archaeon]
MRSVWISSSPQPVGLVLRAWTSGGASGSVQLLVDVRLPNLVVSRASYIHEVIVRMPAGSSATATFAWKVHDAPVDLRFMVDPDNQIIESNETDNILRQLLENGRPPGDSSCEAWRWIPLAVLFLGALAMLYPLRRKH